ncbi:hypothetical protein RKD37_003287 [Streptomyces ambofaciens]
MARAEALSREASSGAGAAALAEGRQGDVVGLGGVVGGVVGRTGVGEDAELVDGVGTGPLPVPAAQQGTGLDEAQRQALGLEPEVSGPVGLLFGEGASGGALQQLHAVRAVQAGEEDLLDGRVGGGCGHLRGGAEEEGALGGGVEQLVEGGAAELEVVQDDDGAHLAQVSEEFCPVRAVQGRAVDGVEEVVEQVVGGAVVTAQPDDAVGREAGAVLGDEVEEAGAAGAGGAGEADGAAAGEQPHQALAFVLAGQQAQDGADRSRGHGRAGGPLRVGAFGRGELLGPGGPLGGRADLYLAAVDGIDGEQEVAGHQLHRAGERGRVLSEVGGEGVPVRARARRLVVAVLAVLLRAPVVRVHWFKPPKSVVCGPRQGPPSRPCRTPHCRFWSGPAGGFAKAAGSQTLNLRPVSPTVRGAGPPERSRSREDCVCRRCEPSLTRGAGSPHRCRPRWRGSGAAGWPPAGAASAAARRAAPVAARSARPAGGLP